MIKTILKGWVATILVIIYIPVSFFAVKNWIRGAKELNQVGYEIPTTYWANLWHNIKKDLWEDDTFFD